MKILVWTAFYFSIMGMLLSAALRAPAIRELIVNYWVAVSNRLESHSTKFAVELFGKLISAFYLSLDGSVSKRKILILSLAASGAWQLFMRISNADAYLWISDEKLSVLYILITTVIMLPAHIAFEFTQAWLLAGLYKRTISSSVRGLFLNLFLFYTFVLFAGFVASAAFVLIPNAEIWKYPLLFPLSTAALLPIALIFDYSGIEAHHLFILPFAITYTGGMVLFFGAIVISNSRHVLRYLCLGIEALSASSYTGIFNASFLLFGLATGVMQAYGF